MVSLASKHGGGPETWEEWEGQLGMAKEKDSGQFVGASARVSRSVCEVRMKALAVSPAHENSPVFIEAERGFRRGRQSDVAVC